MSRPLCSRDFLLLLLAFSLCGGLLAVAAGDPDSKWEAPASERQKKNPIPANESSLSAGKAVYFRRCADCHGKTGNGDGQDAIDLGIHPAKFSDPRMRAEPDGALFWKITQGKKPMPSYEARLTPNERWNVINYVRTLAK
jgi:mono/diheme cytochrome c family protein